MRLSQCKPGMTAGLIQTNLTLHRDPWDTHVVANDLPVSAVEILDVEPIQTHPYAPYHSDTRPPNPIRIKHPNMRVPLFTSSHSLMEMKAFDMQLARVRSARSSANKTAKLLNDNAGDLITAVPVAFDEREGITVDRPGLVAVLFRRSTLEQLGLDLPANNVLRTRVYTQQYRAIGRKLLKKLNLTIKSGVILGRYFSATDELSRLVQLATGRITNPYLTDYPYLIEIRSEHVPAILHALGRLSKDPDASSRKLPENCSQEVLNALS